MNRKIIVKQPPAYPLEHTYAVVIAYWQQQIALGRVKLGKVEAMHELILAGAKSLEVAIPQPINKKRRTNPIPTAA